MHSLYIACQVNFLRGQMLILTIIFYYVSILLQLTGDEKLPIYLMHMCHFFTDYLMTWYWCCMVTGENLETQSLTGKMSFLMMTWRRQTITQSKFIQNVSCHIINPWRCMYHGLQESGSFSLSRYNAADPASWKATIVSKEEPKWQDGSV